MWVSLRTKPKLNDLQVYKIRMIITVVNDEDIFDEFECVWDDKTKKFYEYTNTFSIDDIEDVWVENE